MNEHDQFLAAIRDATFYQPSNREDHSGLGPFADFLQENDRPGAHLARAGLAAARANWSPHVGGHEYQLVPERWHDTRPLEPGGRSFHNAVDLRGPVPRERETWTGLPERPEDLPFYGAPGNVHLTVHNATSDAARAAAPAYLSVTHNSDAHLMGEDDDGRRPWIRYRVPVYSLAHALQLTADLPRQMRREIIRRLWPLVPRRGESPHKLARMRSPAGGAVVNNQFAQGGQFTARAFRRIRDVASKLWGAPAKLSRGEDPVTHDRLVKAIGEADRTIGKVRPKPRGAGQDSTSRLAFADYLQENNVPGAHVVRAHGNRVNDPEARGLGHWLYSAVAIRPEASKIHLLGPEKAFVDGVDVARAIQDAQKPAAQLLLPESLPHVILAAMHMGEDGTNLVHWVPAHTLDELRTLVQDFPKWAQQSIIRKAATRLKRSPTKLARPVTIRVGPPQQVGGPGGFVHHVHDDQGNRIGGISTKYDGGDTLHVTFAGMLGMGEDRFNALGPGVVREGLRQLKAHYPNARRVVGLRVGGAKPTNAGAPQQTAWKLERDDNRDPLIHAVRGQTGGEQNASMVFADHLADTGTPGQHVVRAAPGNWYGGPYNHIINGIYAEHQPEYALGVYVGRRGGDGKFPATVLVSHPTEKERYAHHEAQVYSLKHLHSLIRDFPRETVKAALRAARPFLPTKAPDSPAKLARPHPTTPAETAPVMSGTAVLAGQEPRGTLTLGQLQKIEDAHGLPPEKRLSPRATQGNAPAADPAKPFAAKVEHVAQFFDDLAAHRLGRKGTARVLRDPSNTSEEKLVYLVNHLGHELRQMRGASAANGNEWYGEKINQMDRALHKLMTGSESAQSPMWGTMERGATGPELAGKNDPANHHPAMVLFKALVAATSSSVQPDKNLEAAVRVWRAGAKARPDDPVAGLPTYNHGAKREWFDKLRALWHEKGVDVPEPPAGDDSIAKLREKAKWYAKYVQPFRSQLVAREGEVGYSSLPAQVVMMPVGQEDHPHHGQLVRVNVNGRWQRDPVGSKTMRWTRGNVRLVDLPRTDKNGGGVRSKGWTVRGKSVADQIEKLQRLVSYFRTPETTPLQVYRRAADWLFKTHTRAELEPVMRAIGVKNLDTGFFDPKKDLVPGSFVLGPKFGPFFLNLHANDPATREAHGAHLTADKWWTRTWHRYMGRLVGKGGQINEEPGGRKRRAFMLAAVRRVAHDASTLAGRRVTPAEVQADLWYYEQRLWRMFGADLETDIDFGKAAEGLEAKRRAGKLSRATARTLDAVGAARAARGRVLPLGVLVHAIAGAVGLAPRVRSRTVKLARDDNRGPFVRAIAAANNIKDEGRDATTSLVFADHLAETNTPGQHVVRAAAGNRYMAPIDEGEQVEMVRGPSAAEGERSEWYLSLHRPATRPNRGGVGPASVVSWHTGDKGRGVVMHTAPVHSLRHLYDLVRDFPRDVVKQVVQAAVRELNLPRTAPTDRVQKLARVYVSPDTEQGPGDMGALERVTPGGRSGLGVWSDGHERTRAFDVRDPKAAESFARRVGRVFKQKAVLIFDPDSPGTDVLHVLHVPEADAKKIAADTLAHGIEHKTILPTAAGHEVHVIDFGGAMRPSIEAYAQAAGARSHEAHPGTAKLVQTGGAVKLRA